jgi:D-3-phosphoglycerate dehydrogenase
MTPWKIIVTDGLEETGLNILREQAQVDDRLDISADELLCVAGEYDAMIVRGRTKVTAAVFAAAARLQAVGRAGVGVDNIDLAAARAHGVTVVNAPASTTVAVAELAVGLMLSLARAIPRGDASMKRNEWIKKKLIGAELSGKTLGVIGVGAIGSAVVQRALAFGMAAVGYDALLSSEQIARRGVEPVSLDELYRRSDFISIHTPLTAETRAMIAAPALEKMKDGVRLVCTARGGIIDEAALLAALESGKVAGAGLDVFAQEPPGESALTAHPHVVAMPHVGAQTEEAQARAAVDISHEVLAALSGSELRWKVA